MTRYHEPVLPHFLEADDQICGFAVLSRGTEGQDRVTCMVCVLKTKRLTFNGDRKNDIAGGIAERSVCLRILNSVESIV